MRHRRPSVRIRIAETWETSSRFRYGIVIVAASLLAVCAVIVGFSLAGLVVLAAAALVGGLTAR